MSYVAIKPLLDREPDVVERQLPGGFRVQIERDGPERHYAVSRHDARGARLAGYPRWYASRADAEMLVNRVLDEEGA